jgi:steroid 5-alpha reductase family enzyme
MSSQVSPHTCWAAYITALLCVTAAAPLLNASTALGPFAKGCVLDVLATVVVYFFSLVSDNSSVYDPFWCVAPLWLGFYYKSHAPGGFWFYEPRETLCLLLMWAWAVRFFVGIPWEGWTTGLSTEDWRYAKFRGQLPRAGYWAFSLSSFHLTPSLLILAALAPVARVLLQGTAAPPLNIIDAVGVLVASGGIIIEGVADSQLARFRCSRRSERDTCTSGLWRWSRHPNYCGECVFWSGCLVLGVSSGAVSAEPALAIGAPLLWSFFRFASVPLMDARSLERRRGFDVVMQSVSPLLLWPPRHGHKRL